MDANWEAHNLLVTRTGIDLWFILASYCLHHFQKAILMNINTTTVKLFVRKNFAIMQSKLKETPNELYVFDLYSKPK